MDEAKLTSGASNNDEKTTVTLEDVLKISNNLQRSFIASFSGVQVVVDYGLKGNRFYMAVSEKIYKQIMKQRAADSFVTPSTPQSG